MEFLQDRYFIVFLWVLAIFSYIVKVFLKGMIMQYPDMLSNGVSFVKVVKSVVGKSHAHIDKAIEKSEAMYEILDKKVEDFFDMNINKVTLYFVIAASTSLVLSFIMTTSFLLYAGILTGAAFAVKPTQRLMKG